MTEAKEERPKCPKCGSGQVIIRNTDKTLWCRRCGYDDRKKEN